MDLGAISRDFGRKILRPRKIFEIFDPKCAANRTECEIRANPRVISVLIDSATCECVYFDHADVKTVSRKV